jgi:hypothetical protein
MRKIVLISGGFHPFHAGHAALYQAAKSAFPDAEVIVGATDVQEKRPFPFAIKQALAQIAGVPKKNFIQVQRQFSAADPAIAQIVNGQEDNTALIFVRSEKDQGKPPLPPERDAEGRLPLVTRGPRKGQPVSDYLAYYDSNSNHLDPMTRHAYMAYLPVKTFGSGMTSATEIRNLWPTLDQTAKQKLVKEMYPLTANNDKLTQQAIQLIDMGLGVNTLTESLVSNVLPYLKSALTEFRAGDHVKLQKLLNEWKLLNTKVSNIEKLLHTHSRLDYINEK